MFKGFETIKAQLAELAPAINAFKSEAVQLRIVELIFSRGGEEDGGSPASGERPPTARTPRRRRKAARHKSAAGEASKPEGKKKSGASGPVLTLNELIDGGFFAKHRTLTEIIEHCKNSKAKNFRPDQLSGPLARSVRDERLKRQKNGDGQYEYWK